MTDKELPYWQRYDWDGDGDVDEDDARVFLSRHLLIRLTDSTKNPLPFARCRIVGDTTIIDCDKNGVAPIPVPDGNPLLIDLEWEPKGTAISGATEQFYLKNSFDLYVATKNDVECATRLTNLGFIGATQAEQVNAYQSYFGQVPTGILNDIRDEMVAWHDGGNYPGQVVSVDQWVARLKEAFSGIGTDEKEVTSVLNEAQGQISPLVSSYPDLENELYAELSGDELKKALCLFYEVSVPPSPGETQLDDPQWVSRLYDAFNSGGILGGTDEDEVMNVLQAAKNASQMAALTNRYNQQHSDELGLEDELYDELSGDELKAALRLYYTGFGANTQQQSSLAQEAQVRKCDGTIVPKTLTEMNRQALSVTSFFVTDNIPYIDNEQHFKIGIYSIFGDDIPEEAIKKLLPDAINGMIPQPAYLFTDEIPDSAYGYYTAGKITLSRVLVNGALNDVKKRWLLLEVMLEEYGHHIDYLLRNHYSTIGGDQKGDEGYHFAADFMHYNQLIDKDVTYATIHFSVSLTEQIYTVALADYSREYRCKQLLNLERPTDDHGFIKQKDGSVLEVEFFGFRGAGAVHENITKAAANSAGVPYDFRLDEGCAWPDVPCADVEHFETSYFKTGIFLHIAGKLANRSHLGDLQFWHSMCPTGNHTNSGVRAKILAQLKTWYVLALGLGFEKGLFNLGKALHTIQDSYARSHAYRDESSGIPGKILYFQGYDKQDSTKHGWADSLYIPGSKTMMSPGIGKALAATTQILKYFKAKTPYEPIVREYLEQIYELAPGVGEQQAGNTHPDYAK